MKTNGISIPSSQLLGGELNPTCRFDAAYGLLIHAMINNDASVLPSRLRAVINREQEKWLDGQSKTCDLRHIRFAICKVLKLQPAPCTKPVDNLARSWLWEYRHRLVIRRDELLAEIRSIEDAINSANEQL